MTDREQEIAWRVFFATSMTFILIINFAPHFTAEEYESYHHACYEQSK